MNNTGVVLAENIQKYRKERGFSQKELAEQLGVTYQAVSKWENAKSAPDIYFLPMLADLFACSVDALFSREMQNQAEGVRYKELPWKDDDVLRGVVFLGHNILQETDPLTEKFTFEIEGDTKKVESKCNISVKGTVHGSCNAGGDMEVGGFVTGACNAGRYIEIGGGVLGVCNAGEAIECGGGITGAVNSGNSVTCSRLSSKTLNCGGSLTVKGSVRARKVKVGGDIHCQKMRSWFIRKEKS